MMDLCIMCGVHKDGRVKLTTEARTELITVAKVLNFRKRCMGQFTRVLQRLIAVSSVNTEESGPENPFFKSAV